MDVVAAINAMLEGDSLKIPPGTYTIEPNKISLKKGVTLDLSGVTLKIPAQPKDKSYNVIHIAQPNVTLKGGTLVGDKELRKDTNVKGGYGIRINGSAANVVVKDTVSSKMWLDGFMIDGGKNIILEKVTSDGNRRQGLSICNGSNINVLNSIFKNTRGTPPQAGIDIEPWEKTQLVKGVHISGCQLLNNRGHGITINARHGPVKDVRVEKCTYKSNGGRPLNYWHWNWWQELMADVFKPTSIRIA